MSDWLPGQGQAPRGSAPRTADDVTRAEARGTPGGRPLPPWGLRLLLVLLALLTFAVTTWIGLRPDLASVAGGFFGPIWPFWPVHVVGIVLLVRLVRGRARWAVILSVISPIFIALGGTSVYAGTVMETERVVVTEQIDGSRRAPAEVVVVGSDGTETAWSTTSEGNRSLRRYPPPQVGSEITIVRDPLGIVSTQTAPPSSPWVMLVGASVALLGLLPLLVSVALALRPGRPTVSASPGGVGRLGP